VLQQFFEVRNAAMGADLVATQYIERFGKELLEELQANVAPVVEGAVFAPDKAGEVIADVETDQPSEDDGVDVSNQGEEQESLFEDEEGSDNE